MARKIVLLRYPEVIPAGSWIRNNLLWADELAAFWPAEEPPPTSPEQEAALADLRVLTRARIFAPRRVDVQPREVTGLLNRIPEEVVTGKQTAWLRDNQALIAGLEQDSGSDNFQDELGFAYASKFNDVSLAILRERGAFTPGNHPRGTTPGYLAAPAVLDLLLQAAAEKEAGRRPKTQLTLPVPSRPSAARGLLEPRLDRPPDVAAVLQMPLVPKVHSEQPLEALIELRMKPAFAQGRRDYLEGLAALVTELQQAHNPQGEAGLDPYVHVLAAAKIATDVASARQSYLKQIDTRDVVVALSSLAMHLLVSIGSSQTADPREVAVTAAANIAADGVGIVGAFLRRTNAPTFLSEFAGIVEPPPRQ